jgi:Tfp pilus assembly protein PilV
VERVLQIGCAMRCEPSGFSLVETLIATTITIVGIAGLAQLFVVSSAANGRAKSATLSTILAQDKIEELLTPGGDAGDGSDFLDGVGRLIASGETPPAGTAYVRRWSVQPLSEASPTAFLIQVSVTTASGRVDARITGVRSGSALR